MGGRDRDAVSTSLSDRAAATFLRDEVERILIEQRGAGVRLASIEVDAMPRVTRHTTSVIRARLESGEIVRILFKDYGATPLAANLEQRIDRERYKYMEILRQFDLGTPLCYGSSWDLSRGHRWLFLEFVEGAELRDCGIESWHHTAGWLGAMQARTETAFDTFNRLPFLRRLNEDFFRQTAAEAVSSVTAFGDVALTKHFEHIVDVYFSQIEAMAASRSCLVHGK